LVGKRYAPAMHDDRYDVVIVGGGAAGVAAAIGARRCGARTLLVETYGCLGGAATMKNVLSYCGLYTCGEVPRQVVFGVAESAIRELHAVGAASEPKRLYRGVIVLFDPEAVKYALDRLAEQAGVEVLLHTAVIGATRSGDRLTSVVVADRTGSREIAADAFVDASGDADLAFFAGASTRYGNHGFLNIGTLSMRIGSVAPDVVIRPEAWAEAVREAKRRGVAPLNSETGFLGRIPISGDVLALVIDEDYDAREGASISRAESHGRAQAWAYLEAIRAMPGYERAHLVSTGPVIGTRESRHLNARYQLTRNDVATGARFEDVVAIGAWPMEFHPEPGGGSTWLPIGNDDTFDIPLRSLQSADTTNLFSAGRTADGDQYAGASIRVMGTAFATGQAAGIAAAQIPSGGAASIAAVRRELDRQDARLPRSLMVQHV
jgi:FAD dependent oxidoreductase